MNGIIKNNYVFFKISAITLVLFFMELHVLGPLIVPPTTCRISFVYSYDLVDTRIPGFTFTVYVNNIVA